MTSVLCLPSTHWLSASTALARHPQLQFSSPNRQAFRCKQPLHLSKSRTTGLVLPLSANPPRPNSLESLRLSPFGYSLMADSSKFGHSLLLPDSRFAPLLVVCRELPVATKVGVGYLSICGKFGISPAQSHRSPRRVCTTSPGKPIAE